MTVKLFFEKSVKVYAIMNKSRWHIFSVAVRDNFFLQTHGRKNSIVFCVKTHYIFSSSNIIAKFSQNNLCKSYDNKSIIHCNDLSSHNVYNDVIVHNLKDHCVNKSRICD